MSDFSDAALIRELERRAFARPRDAAGAADAAAAAAELSALRPPAPPAQPVDTGLGSDADPGDETAGRSWMRSAATTVLARATSLSRNERRGIAIAAAALALLTGILVAAHAALTAPPPAFAVFDETPSGAATASDDDDAGSAVRSQLEGRGIDVVGGPHVFGEPTREPRLTVYRQWVGEGVVEVCGGVLIDGAFLAGEVCTSDAAFRAQGLVGSFVDGAYRIDFAWAPDGTPRLELVQLGATTLEEVRELGIPALASLEADPTPADALIWNYEPDTIAGPLLLAEIDGVQYVGLLTGDDDALGRLGDAPAFCLWIGDVESNAGSCASVEEFAANGVVGRSTSSTDQEARFARWLPTGELVEELP